MLAEEVLQQIWSFGDDGSLIGDYAWYASNSGSITHSVSGKKSNSFGLWDMHGNASEWVWDWYPAGAPYYDVTQTNNPTGPAVGSSRVVRGGNWTNLSRSIRSASRILAKSDERDNSIGFRLAKTM